MTGKYMLHTGGGVKNHGTTPFGNNKESYRFWYSGTRDVTNGVGLPVKHDLVERVHEMEIILDRLMKIRMVLS